MITIKKKSTTVKYPFDELVKLLEESPKPGTIALNMIGIKTKFALAPKIILKDSLVRVQERRLNALYYPDRNGNTIVEYRFEIYWITLILWILSIFFVVGLVYIPIIIISTNLAVAHRIKSINKHAFDVLADLNPVSQESKVVSKIEQIQKPAEIASKTPPPLRRKNQSIEYFVYVNDNQMGPYDFEKIKLLLEYKNINGSTMVWKEGMEDWDLLVNVEELALELKK